MKGTIWSVRHLSQGNIDDPTVSLENHIVRTQLKLDPDEMSAEYPQDIEWCAESDDDERRRNVEFLAKKLAAAGAEVKCSKDMNVVAFKLNKPSRERLFERRLAELKEAVEKLTLEEFSSSPGKIWAMEELMSDKSGDGCILNGWWLTTLVSAFRRLDDDVWYIASPEVQAHD